jgi:hypothetical protein
VAVNKELKKFKNTLAVLSAEMALPAITASAFTVDASFHTEPSSSQAIAD